MPHQKELVAELKDRPFAIIGINSDGDAEKVNTILKEQGITWRQAIDGTTQGPLAKRWNVQGWPTIYIIDAKGVIRFKGGDARGKNLAKNVEELFEEMGSKKSY